MVFNINRILVLIVIMVLTVIYEVIFIHATFLLVGNHADKRLSEVHAQSRCVKHLTLVKISEGEKSDRGADEKKERLSAVWRLAADGPGKLVTQTWIFDAPWPTNFQVCPSSRRSYPPWEKRQTTISSILPVWHSLPRYWSMIAMHCIDKFWAW